MFAVLNAFGKLPNAAGWQPALPRYAIARLVLTFLVRDAFAPAPVPKRKISTYHPAKMRKVRYALVSAKDSAEKFKQRVKNYEDNRGHWNWRNQQDDRPARKKEPERQ